MSGRPDPLPPDILIARESRLEPKQVDQFRRIYVESFPPSERNDFDELVQEISHDNHWLFIVKTGGKLVGIAVILPAIMPRVHLLEYLAIAPDWHRRGLGSQLMREISDRLRSGANGILLEVETPEDTTEEEKLIRQRRIEFYLRNGAHMVECAPPYRVPNLAGPGTVGMKLMWLPLEIVPVPTGNLLSNYLLAIYTKSYGLPPDDPLVQTGLENLTC